MHIDLPQARSRKLSLTSLIDVIFLLLLFFMLTSTFTRFGEIEIAPPGGNRVSPGKGPDIIVTVSPNGLRVNGQTATEETAAEVLRRLVAKGAKAALLIPKGEATTQELIRALETLHRVDGLSVAVAK